MSINIDLKRDLPMGLQDELNQTLTAREEVLISLPGSFGEALVVTDKRAIIIRERENSLNAGCDIFSYPLKNIKGAEANASSTGGFLEILSSEPVADPESVRVYFPSYEMDRFQQAASQMKQITQHSIESVGAVVSSTAAKVGLTGSETCSECKAPVCDSDIFCASCGNQLKLICASCTAASPVGSEYCTGCGSNLVELDTACVSCGGRVQKWMSYCPQCGSVLSAKCAACGMPIVSGWVHCPGCGRQIGTDRLDGRACQLSVRKHANVEKPKAQIQEAETPSAVTSSQTQTTTTAEACNKRGLELFDEDKLDEAIAEFMAAVRLEPDNASYHCNLAVAYDECDRDKEALAEYLKALALDPNDVTALLSLGYLYNENDEPEKATEVWQRLVDAAPHSPEAEEARENLRHQRNL